MLTSHLSEYILKVHCPAASGIVAAISGCLAQNGCYISEMAQYDDEVTGYFFTRIVFRFEDGIDDLERLKTNFAQIEQQFDMQASFYDCNSPMKVMIMVSKFDHCFLNLLYRHHKGELDFQITAIVSNHLDLRPIAEREGLRFIYLPVNKETKAQQEAELLRIIDETETELVILARYMQILSDQLCRQLAGRAINIHHSFLPGFKGAKPYHQAFERGVKLIGATAHFVTGDLDEGPIIEQEVQRVDHAYLPEDLVSVGRDTETVALSKAVKYFVEHRVFLNDDRTVIFK
ncbi:MULTISPECIES: formyltetrahydrofolate deformylase [unclassified Acinetobacter]|uniref:formyltetrahydrofolate deformylase n=1 Tax=unclassified Acinetobacter TaxID=196816 RepID=UPI0029342404|nr:MULTISPECIES: formyltetrahydrofolate deformylase [unclassified Acinetobacter]WOE32453.1 formyltetrahydrofolate deformylase [Acinetobacter sp. SAAs470]WOE37928.1 formyltetrahydrofolate deformylase [Acinetobacter sp. SAAs474]